MISIRYFENALAPNDRPMYKSMIKGKAVSLNTAISNTDRIRKVNLILLSAHPKFLNFRAKISIRETINNENMMVIATSNQS